MDNETIKLGLEERNSSERRNNMKIGSPPRRDLTSERNTWNNIIRGINDKTIKKIKRHLWMQRAKGGVAISVTRENIA